MSRPVFWAWCPMNLRFHLLLVPTSYCHLPHAASDDLMIPYLPLYLPLLPSHNSTYTLREAKYTTNVIISCCTIRRNQVLSANRRD
ncbi:hypothetical protein BDR04DRAFT_1057371, partial [Suillus decipiens]